MSLLPPLDTHAHVAYSVSKRELEELGAVVFIATRSLAEYELVSKRDDLVSVWGVGCHPSLVGVQKAYDPIAFKSAIAKTPYVAEVGLDGASRVPLDRQREVLASILSITKEDPRIVSLHSFGAVEPLVDLLRDQSARPGHILHWWLGSATATEEAVALGCYFSVNFSMARKPELIASLPRDRILVETDHPSGDRFSSRPRQPGRVQDVERLLARHFGISIEDFRLQCWKNLAEIVSATRTEIMMPMPIKRMIATARTHQWMSEYI